LTAAAATSEWLPSARLEKLKVMNLTRAIVDVSTAPAEPSVKLLMISSEATGIEWLASARLKIIRIDS
jgi:hypothetical protein